MGIRVSYKGADGSTRSFIANGRTSMEARLKHISETAGGGKPSQDVQETTATGVETAKVDPNGSIENGLGGRLRLKGDTTMTNSATKAKSYIVYGRRRNGNRGWCTLADIDPEANGKSVGGSANNSDTPDASEKKQGEDVPFSEEYLTRIVLGSLEDNDDKNNKYKVRTLWAFFRKRKTTAGGRTFAVGPERSFYLGSVGADTTGLTVKYVGDIRYNTRKHCIEKKVITLNLETMIENAGDWEAVEGGQAVEHVDKGVVDDANEEASDAGGN